jgi:hypothetical protein
MEAVSTLTSTVEAAPPPTAIPPLPPPPPRKRMRLQSRNEQKREPSSPPPGRDKDARNSASVASVESSAKPKVATAAAEHTIEALSAAPVAPEPKRPRLSAAPKPADAVSSRRLGGQYRNETLNSVLDAPIHNVLTEHDTNVETHSATSTRGSPTKIPGTATTMSTVATAIAEPPSLEPIDAVVSQTAMPTKCGITTHDNDATVARIGKRRRRRWDCRPEETTVITEPRAEQSADKENDSMTVALFSTGQKRCWDAMADAATGSMTLSSSSGAHSFLPEHLNSLVTRIALTTSSDEMERDTGFNLLACFDSEEDEPTFI